MLVDVRAEVLKAMATAREATSGSGGISSTVAASEAAMVAKCPCVSY